MTIITMLAAANGSRISIRGQPCIHFPDTYLDHHEKFGCWLLTVCAHV